MAQGKYGVARAAHDLIDVHTLDIAGWTGENRVVPSDGHNVEIEAPKRSEGEYWTFAQQREGVLKCHSSLIGSPGLLTARDPDTGRPWVMTIKVPAARMKNLNIRTR